MAGTINYEITCRIESGPRRARRRSSMLERRARSSRRGRVDRRRRSPRRAARQAVLDLDIACAIRGRPREAYGKRARRRRLSALGAARGMARRLDDGRTVDFTPLPAGSRTTWPGATSRSTRSRARSPVGTSSTPLGATTTSTSASSARCGRACSGTTRSACCVPSGSRTSSDSGSTRRPRSSSAATPGSSPAGRRAHPRRAAAAVGARLSPSRRARSARAARRPRRPARARRLAATPPVDGSLRRGAGTVADLEPARPVRALRAERGAADRPLAALDPSFPAGDRAVGARRARATSAATSWSRRSRAARASIQPGRSCAATSSVCRRGPRSGGCSS